MGVKVVQLEEKYLEAAVKIWNDVVEDGKAFPQTEPLSLKEGREFLRNRLTRQQL